ncbi:uncharacterized protein LOC124278738 [Haliotis rubra]|uniref:uncharacterized protein LOC124278738 n=1 Tax=Haliotis rubra TaxID=36100 RepID=UPI001EE4FE31|nr:uncharacterized protein LOC124278738 [Haliotis rubra]
MYIAVVCLCLLAVGVQSASVTDLSGLKQLSQPKTYTCTPTCGAGQCCVHFYTPVHGRRQLQPIDLPLNNPYPGITTMCKTIPTSGEKCLVHNPGEWCDCAAGLSCRPNGKTGLDAFFGTCI